MTGDLGSYIVFALGILVGGILFNKDFRYKFFKGLRGFLAQISSGARNYSEKYAEGRSRKQTRERYPREVTQGRPEVQHIYKQTHTASPCPTCKGSGRVFGKVSPLQSGAPGFKPKAIDCPTCEGEGRVWD